MKTADLRLGALYRVRFLSTPVPRPYELIAFDVGSRYLSTVHLFRSPDGREHKIAPRNVLREWDDNPSLTNEQVERICDEAIAQGWAKAANEYGGMGAGKVETHDFDGQRSVTLRFPGLWGGEYYVRHMVEWRKLRAKVDELESILEEVEPRGWTFERDGNGFPTVRKTGDFSMAIEVRTPLHRVGVRVGGLRTWRKLLAEHDAVIDVPPEPKELPRQDSSPAVAGELAAARKIGESDGD